MKSGVSSLLKRKKALMSWQHPIAAAGWKPVFKSSIERDQNISTRVRKLTLEGTLIFAFSLHWLSAHVCP